MTNLFPEQYLARFIANNVKLCLLLFHCDYSVLAV